MIENIRLSFRGIWSHKLRSFLTMLGIIIGIAAIIAIVSTIKGTNEQIQKNLIGSGENNITVSLNEGDWEYSFSSGIPSGVSVIRDGTYDRLKNIDHVEQVALYNYRQEYEGIYHNSDALTGGYVYGIDENYFSVAGEVVRQGRGITPEDRKLFRKVCLLDENSAQSLFQGKDPIGKTVEIKSEPFRVIGVIAEYDTFEPVIETLDDWYTYHVDTSGAVYVPDTVWPMIYQFDEPQYVLLKASHTNYLTAIGKEAESILNEEVLSDTYQYKARDLLEQARQIQQLSQSTNTMLLWIAGISLLVGGIGVMNIMLVSVTERTSEIGLKKAIGARKKTIMIQFLTEAVALTSMGGILGVLTGILLAQLISMVNGTPVAISFEAALFAVLFSMVIGIVFGIMPSWKAANLDPIEALRHE